MQHIQFAQERISLSLYFDDIEQALPQLTAPVHAWYLDGFAPARNPQMWSQSLFKTLRLLSKPTPLWPLLPPQVKLNEG